MSVRDAVVTACRVRLRPILMTSLATIIGMIPMAMKLGEGGEQYTPMARAIIGGLAFSTIISLLVLPTIYVLLDDLGFWSSKVMAAAKARGQRKSTAATENA